MIYSYLKSWYIKVQGCDTKQVITGQFHKLFHKVVGRWAFPTSIFLWVSSPCSNPFQWWKWAAMSGKCLFGQSREILRLQLPGGAVTTEQLWTAGCHGCTYNSWKIIIFLCVLPPFVPSCNTSSLLYHCQCSLQLSLADPGKAMGCSTNTFVINSLIH